MAKIEAVAADEPALEPSTVPEPSPQTSDKPVVTFKTTQPGAKEPPDASGGVIALSTFPTHAAPVKEEVAAPIPAPPPSAPPRKARKRVWGTRWYRTVRLVTTILSGLWRVFFILGCIIGVALVLALIMGISLGFAAANGTIFMLIGNAIFNAVDHSGYTGNAEAAAVGAVGGVLAGICVGVVFETFVPKTEASDQGYQHAWWLRCIATVITGTLTGPIGCSILRRHMDLKGLDILHAARAGAVGGTIMGVGAIFLAPLLLLAIGIILAPLWIAMAMGFEFIHAKTSENWGPNSHSYSTCYCFATCGDEEIEEEVRRIEDIERRHREFQSMSTHMALF